MAKLSDDEFGVLAGVLERLSDEERARVAREMVAEPLLTTAQAAKNLGLSPESIRRACRAKRIPHKVWGMVTGKPKSGDYRFGLDDLVRIREMMTVDVEPEGRG
ncbi:helix-turn-helix domain-containing protein [Desulfocurvus sp. DL9XJH121]